MKIGLAAYIVALTAVFAIPQILAQNQKQNHTSAIGMATSDVGEGSVSAGPAMFAYYQYKNGFYQMEYPGDSANSKVNADFKAIQNKIVRCLGRSVYEISGYDPAKNVAIFTGGYYYKADYAFAAGVDLNGSAYVLSPAPGPDGDVDASTGKIRFKLGKFLGSAGPYRAYLLPGSGTDEKIAIELDGSHNFYCLAYRMPESVSLNGREYYLDPMQIGSSSTDGLQPLGKAGTYDIYRDPNVSDDKSVIVKLGARQTVAFAYEPSTDEPYPSRYGTPQESMYPIWSNIIFNDTVYMFSASFDYNNHQKELESQLGSKLGECIIRKYTYGIYEIKRTGPKVSVAVQNNQVYLKYDFQFSAVVKYNEAEYLMTQDFGGTVGRRIGTTEDGHEVRSVVGVDPQQEIVVILSDGTHPAVRR